MKFSKKVLTSALAVLTAVSITACSSNTDKQESKQTKQNDLILATTTSTQDSGLLDYLLPEFTKDTGIKVKTIAVGTGKAIKMGEDGEADVLLVHDTKSENKFVKDGNSKERHDVMYNDFVIVGPKEDPLKLKEITGENKTEKALKKIQENQAKFISRSDDSGTNKKELKLWQALNIDPKGNWYVEAGAGMGDVLKMASEKKAYTLTDRGTYLSMKDKLNLDIVVEKDKDLKNQYGVMCVNPDKFKNINNKEAKNFEEWILSSKVQKEIENFKKEEYGQSLFTPNAK
ncbi:extracellular solute-binding protein [Paraclostridium ghonii]|uniref:Tungstate transport system substrate-binding protein n=1 Tax=Paraclostridium ghonii TaxID=29358 RepID=A0ABU0N4K7_9FIRM|nr:substrate-binding domain-containing protein [Paeniclostridium ghonii]MDQ0557753.1 tungstate transport system substrate-binding protein [Paeniclostridium ghonii]